MASILIESAKILIGDDLTTAHILLEDGLIKAISKLRPASTPDEKIDARGLIALPGMIDAHVHLRDLDLSYKETFETGTRAAAVGGFTTLLDMPNSRPATVNAYNLVSKISSAEGHLFSNVAFQAALVNDADEMKRMVDQGAIAFKLYLNKAVETFDSSKNAQLSLALEAAKRLNAIVTVHAEDGDSIRKSQKESVARGKTSINDFLKAHSPQAEVGAVRRVLSLGKRFGVRLHICHITLPKSVKLVRQTPNATCEATPHHLLLNESIFRTQKTFAMCVPPIRRRMAMDGLWKLFSQGRVEIMASDHAPHTLEEKMTSNAWSAATGVPGLETSLPVLFTQVAKGALSMRRLIEATATIPARIFQLTRKGALKEGYDADLVLVDPKAKTVVNPENFQSKAKYSPFKGRKCVGTAAFTILNGVVVAERGRIVGPAVGRVTKTDRKLIPT